MNSTEWSKEDYDRYFLAFEMQDSDLSGAETEDCIVCPVQMNDDFYRKYCGEEIFNKAMESGGDDYFNTWMVYKPKDDMLYFYVNLDKPSGLSEICPETEITGEGKNVLIKSIKDEMKEYFDFAECKVRENKDFEI